MQNLNNLWDWPQEKENFSWFQTIFTFGFRTARSDWALPFFNALVCRKCAGGFYQSDIWAETFFLARNAETRYNGQEFCISQWKQTNPVCRSVCVPAPDRHGSSSRSIDCLPIWWSHQRKLHQAEGRRQRGRQTFYCHKSTGYFFHIVIQLMFLGTVLHTVCFVLPCHYYLKSCFTAELIKQRGSDSTWCQFCRFDWRARSLLLCKGLPCAVWACYSMRCCVALDFIMSMFGVFSFFSVTPQRNMSHLTIQTHFNGWLNHPSRRGGERPTFNSDVWRQFGGFCCETEYFTEVKWNFVCRSFLQRSLWLAVALNVFNWLNETIPAVWLEVLDVEKLLYLNDSGFLLEILPYIFV